ncbi:hypothetical protein [Ruegeria conchae]|nr:hypothetical protein [Ruegeria conchae]
MIGTDNSFSFDSSLFANEKPITVGSTRKFELFGSSIPEDLVGSAKNQERLNEVEIKKLAA